MISQFQSKKRWRKKKIENKTSLLGGGGRGGRQTKPRYNLQKAKHTLFAEGDNGFIREKSNAVRGGRMRTQCPQGDERVSGSVSSAKHGEKRGSTVSLS